MIDFIKYELTNTNPDTIEGNRYLEFHNKVNVKTGELGTYLNAYYKGLEFKIYLPTETHPNKRITVEGSLHKYWNNGAHNFNDFGINQINEVLNELKNKFLILPENCVLKTLEIGVNINPPTPTKQILNNCLLHKNNRLKWIYTNDEGNYIQNKKQRHIIKIYDKKTHYKKRGFNISNEIMRIEKKYSRMHELNQKGIYTIADLLKYDLKNFTPVLLIEWQNVIYYDDVILKGTKYEFKYSNPTYWLNLNNGRFKYHKNNLNKLTQNNPKSIKNVISNLIQEKADFLNTKTYQINPLHILLKREVSTSEKNRRFCIVTGLNISMQKEDSFLLSHTGLKYYYKTDKKIFKEVESRYLSTLWIDADYTTKIKEIAHNIRNKINNQRLKQNRLYPQHQTQLFDISL